jgi:hypothetical protein
MGIFLVIAVAAVIGFLVLDAYFDRDPRPTAGRARPRPIEDCLALVCIAYSLVGFVVLLALFAV